MTGAGAGPEAGGRKHGQVLRVGVRARCQGQESGQEKGPGLRPKLSKGNRIE